MKYNPEKHRRRSVRIPGYDYSQDGGYFVTICEKDRFSLFGEIINNQIKLNAIGKHVQYWWYQISQRYPNVELDEYIIMPNHMHGIIIIKNYGNCRGEVTSPLQFSQQCPSLGKIMAYFKYQSTKHVNQLRNTPGHKLWQRNYWEHIVRNEMELNRIRNYIQNNPVKWKNDRYYQ